jgi:cyclopropane fatty-acyl-phospholipid synthase-like methyltransferase
MPGETVLDAACCTGYGSHILGLDSSVKVLGREVDEGCIAEADGRWKPSNPNLDFKVLDLDKDEWPDADVLVTIETAEHVQDFKRFVKQTTKHIKRCVVFCVPLGGTSHAYSAEQQALPAGECNDFNNIAHVESIFDKAGWKLQTSFDFGYSGFFVFFKKPPKVPKGYDKNAFPQKGYIAP